MTSSPSADAAARYIARGLRPVPVWGVAGGQCQCGNPASADHGKMGQGVGKHPVDRETWKNRLYTASDFSPGNNLALAMGKQRDGRWLVALDVDGDVPLERWLGPLPDTLTARTGRGTHRIFVVEPFAPLGNWRDAWRTRDPRRGYRPGFSGALDVRYARGAIVAPPSVHRNGTRYHWINDLDPAPLPAAAIRALLRRRAHAGLPVARRWDRDGALP